MDPTWNPSSLNLGAGEPFRSGENNIQSLARLIYHYFEVTGVIIWSADQGNYRIKGLAGQTPPANDLVRDLAGLISAKNSLFIVPDTAIDNRLAALTWLGEPDPWRFLVVKGFFSRGAPKGGFALLCREAQVFGQPKTRALEDFARLVEIMLDKSGAEVAGSSGYLTALADSEERFRELSENIDDVFWLISLEPREILYMSPSYERLFKRPVSEVLENPVNFTKGIHPEDRHILGEKIAEWSQKPGIMYYEVRMVRPDGEVRWVQFRVFPVRDHNGRVYRMGGLIEDITAALQAEEETKRNLAKEAELNELRTQVITLVSHEFRTPLSAILSTSELLQYYEWPSEKKLELFRRIQVSVKHMTQMLDDILLIGKAEAGKLEFAPERLDLAELCRRLVEEVQAEIILEGRLEFSFAGGEPVVEVDPKLIRQILVNLLSNAVKYSGDESVVRVSLEIDRAQGQAIIRVKDDGMGIPQEDQAYLFEVFHRASNVGNIGGAGLGLAIARRSAEKHGGTIEVVSELDKGTTFTVKLPVKTITE